MNGLIIPFYGETTHVSICDLYGFVQIQWLMRVFPLRTAFLW